MATPKHPTIAQELAKKLGRQPTDRECCNEVRRILGKESIEEERARAMRRRKARSA